MTRVLAINGSARKERGYTAMLLEALLEGMEAAGAETELVVASKLDVRPCTGEFDCWFKHVGLCYQHDDMDGLYPKLRAADVLVLGIPVYVPFPGDMQNLVNRLMPLVEPILEIRDGRTRARFHENVRISKIVLVSCGGWWEAENMDKVVHSVQDMAEDASVAFEALLRPHAHKMRELPEEGEAILAEVREAGRQLVAEGRMDPETLERVSRPLVPFEEYNREQTEMHLRARDGDGG
jgi:multimeric flavodoxin WrbA